MRSMAGDNVDDESIDNNKYASLPLLLQKTTTTATTTRMDKVNYYIDQLDKGIPLTYPLNAPDLILR